MLDAGACYAFVGVDLDKLPIVSALDVVGVIINLRRSSWSVETRAYPATRRFFNSVIGVAVKRVSDAGMVVTFFWTTNVSHSLTFLLLYSFQLCARLSSIRSYALA